MWDLRGLASRCSTFRTELRGGGHAVRIPLPVVVRMLQDKYHVSRRTAYNWINIWMGKYRSFWIKAVDLRLVHTPGRSHIAGIFKGPGTSLSRVESYSGQAIARLFE